MNNDKAQEFVITVWREESNQVEDLDTGLRHSDTDLDTGLRHFDTDLDTELRHYSTDLDTKRVTLTNKEKDIVNFCSVPRTTKEILDRIGVSMHSKNRERYITSLVAAGYLQMTNPDNPTASNQKYKKVNKRKEAYGFIISTSVCMFYIHAHQCLHRVLIPVGWIIWQCGGFVLPVFMV